MATSSITKNFVIRGKQEVEAFINLLDSEPEPMPKLNAKEVTDPEEIRRLIALWGAAVKNERA